MNEADRVLCLRLQTRSALFAQIREQQANIAAFESRRAELEKAAAEVLATAQSRAAAIAAIGKITIKANAGEEGKLFGSIGVTDIIDAAAAAGFSVERREVALPDAIRNIGEFEVTLQLHSDVAQNITLTVEAE